MVAPLAIAGASAVGALIGSPVAGMIGAHISPIIEVEKRRNTYRANNQRPNLLPDPQSLIEAYFRGALDPAFLYAQLQQHGIANKQTPGFEVWGEIWESIIDGHKPRLPLDVALRASALGEDLSDPLWKIAARLGYRSPVDRGQLVKDTRGMGLGTILPLWWRGDINDDELEKYLKHDGWQNDAIRRLVSIARVGPAGSELLLMLNRGILNERHTKDYMKWSGITGADEQDALLALRYQYPSPSEVSLMATRHVFNEAYVRKFHLDDLQPEQYAQIVSQLGFNWTPSANGPQPPNAGDTTIKNLMWRAHWRVIDPGSATLMLWRLRPTGGPNNGPRDPSGLVFTEQDFDDVLTSNEVIPGAKPLIRAISQAIPQRLIVKRLFASGIIDRAEVKETVKDQGYSDARAEQLTKLIEYEVGQAHVDRLRPMSLSQIERAYRVGSMGDKAAAIALYVLFLKNYDLIETFLKQSLASQAAEALSNSWVRLTLSQFDNEVKAELIAEAVNVIHKAYLRAEFTALDAQAQLITIGIVADRAASYTQLWSYELAAEGAEVTAAKLVSWYQDHLIDAATLQTRLLRLHYSVFDVSLMMASANLKLALAQQKIEAASEKLKAQQAKAAAAALKALEKQKQEMAKIMCKSGSPVQVARWAFKDIITYKEAYTRMTECGKSDEDAINMLMDAQKGKGALTLAQVKEKAGLSTANGTAASSSASP